MMAHNIPTWLRITIPAALVILWFVAAGIGGPYFGKIDEVSSNDSTTFLPKSAESTKAQEQQGNFRGTAALPAIIVLERPSGLTPKDYNYATQLRTELQGIKELSNQVSPVIPSEDKKAIQLIANIERKGDVNEVVADMRERASQSPPEGLRVYVAGPAGFLADLTNAFGGIDGILLVVALSVVFLILLAVYRSPSLPFLVLFTSMFALTVSVLIVWWLAKKGVIKINGQVQGILFILVIGAATDYSLLYVSRFKEALQKHSSTFLATVESVKNAYQPIVASGATIIAGLLCLLASDLNSNKALGPVAAIGIGMAVAAALTFLPSLLLIFGKKSFWPMKIHRITPSTEQPLWQKIANTVDMHYRPIWIVSLVVLITMTIGLVQFNADGVQQSKLILGSSEARNGQEAQERHFAGGAGSPTIVVTSADTVSQVNKQIAQLDNVDAISVASKASPSSNLPVILRTGSIQSIGGAQPTVVDNKILLQVTLATASDSLQSEEAVRAIRNVVHTIDKNGLVGGPSASALDTRTSSQRDRNVIIPMILVVITIILMALLRSVIAPLLLLATTVLSFAATMGLASVLFENVFHFPGSDPAVPLYSFVFLVALGIDYNIFLMTRVREETFKLGTRKGVLRGLAITGGVITSAGVVLAATFSALAVIPILFLLQIAFIVGFGVLLDTIVIRSLLVPALMREVGSKAWWPSGLTKLK